MLTVSSLNTHYGQAHILRDVSFKVDPGECVALLGRNGAGKSTTMKAIIGLVTAASGKIVYNDKSLRRLKSYRRAQLGIGYVPEERRIFGHLTVRENLLAGMQPARAGRAPWTAERVFGLFPAFEELAEREGRTLSGGEQQMLTVGRTLMGNPDCLLLDEPTEGLAPIIVAHVMAAIETLKKEGLSILWAEQNRKIARRLADRVLVLEKGTLLHDGSLDALSVRAKEALGAI